MKNNKGITLLEIILAGALLTLIAFAAGSIYLTGWKMFQDGRFLAQAQRNALVPMTHMVKQLQEAVKFNRVSPQKLEFVIYRNFPSDTRTRQYEFTAQGQIEYDPNTDPAFTGDKIIIGSHIDNTNSEFTVTHDSNTNGAVVDIKIVADDNEDQGINQYTLTSSIEAKYASAPPVY